MGVDSSVGQFGADKLAVEAGDVGNLDALGTFHLTGAGVRTVAESEFVHLGNHSLGAACSLDAALGEECKLRYLGGDEQHGRAVLAGSYAGAAADA